MDVNKFKTRYTGEATKNYVKSRRLTPQWVEETKIMEEFLSRFPSKTIVDIPVGTGRFMTYYARFKNKVIGLDISPDMLAQARDEATRQNADVVSIEQADIFELDAKRYPADVAVCLRMINHFETPWVPKALKSLAALGREAVIVSIRTLDPNTLTEQQRRVYERQQSERDRPSDKPRSTINLHMKSDFDRWIEELGLVVEDSRNVLVTPNGGHLDIYILKHRGTPLSQN